MTSLFMTSTSEIKRLLTGANPDENPGGLGVFRFEVYCDRNAEQVLQRIKEVLQIVLSQNEDAWLDEQRIINQLPAWFIDQCAQEPVEVTSDEKWSIADWLYWFEPDNRYWFWWDAEVKNQDLIHVDIEVHEFPYPYEALLWLLRASGAKSIASS
jgi:hypothetical protein